MFTRARAFDELGLEDVEVEQGEEGAVDNVTKMKMSLSYSWLEHFRP